MTRAIDEYVFEGWPADVHRLNLAGEDFHHLGGETMSLCALQTNRVLFDRTDDSKSAMNALGQCLGIVGFELNHVPPDLRLQLRGRAQRDDFAVTENRQTIAAVTRTVTPSCARSESR